MLKQPPDSHATYMAAIYAADPVFECIQHRTVSNPPVRIQRLTDARRGLPHEHDFPRLGPWPLAEVESNHTRARRDRAPPPVRANAELRVPTWPWSRGRVSAKGGSH